MNLRIRLSGVALIEVMIAVLILAIGVVGAIGLQAKSLSALSNAGARVDATIAAEKVIGLMSTDQANLATYVWDGTGTAPTALGNWWLEVNGDASTTPPTPGLLPNATVVITVTAIAGSTASLVSVTLTWQRRTGANGDPLSAHTIVATLGPAQ